MPEGVLARGARGLVAGWAGLGNVTAVADPGLCRHLPSTSDLGLN